MSEYRKISKEELQHILEQHKLWVESNGEQGQRANLQKVDFQNANFQEAFLQSANLQGANFQDANLQHADLWGTDLQDTDFRRANLRATNLAKAKLQGTNLQGVNLKKAIFGYTLFAEVDLSSVRGLKDCIHFGPSTIGLDTIYKSGGNIPEVFLRGCGVPDIFIEYMHSLVGKKLDIYSCFISYSHADEDFAQRLHSALQSHGVRCWYAPQDMQGGKKLYDQIDSAIRVHDKTLLCLSESSMGSKWVETELRRTRKAIDKTGKQKLFPISIVDFKKVKDWECFDANTGSDMADEVREFYIPDFSNWKDHDSFQKEFDKVLRDLKRDE